jgi:lycopene beta-cyclase
MTKADYIILGAGASGLMLAYRMSQDVFFDDKSILIIDKLKDKGNDRTWCYWEDGQGEWDSLLTKTWSSIFFGSDFYSNTINISPYRYKMIRSENFYKSLWDKILVKTNFRFVEATVESLSETQHGVKVLCNQSEYFCSKLFNSLPNSDVYQQQKKFPVLQQHFVGWFVKTEKNLFDDNVATFMDFSIPQDGNTRFMYVLPIDSDTTLFEYTLFSEKLLPYAEYEEAIKVYLNDKGIFNYEILEKEMGSIPMTSFEFLKLNSKHVLNIGTAGGWTKASTGYTFKKTSKKTKEVIAFLKTEMDLSKFSKKTKFWFYDMLFLDVLGKHNNEGAALFSSMFKKANTTTILKFLDEDSTLIEDLKVILSVPSKRFIQALLRRIF